MAADRPISEDELHAYLDGDMAAARRVDIALYLARHPEDAARMEVFRAQREAIHALFDDLLDQPAPLRLRSIIQRHAARRARRRRGTSIAVGIVVAALVLAAGRALPPDGGAERNGAAAQHNPAAEGVPVIRPLDPLRSRQRNFDI